MVVHRISTSWRGAYPPHPPHPLSTLLYGHIEGTHPQEGGVDGVLPSGHIWTPDDVLMHYLPTTTSWVSGYSRCGVLWIPYISPHPLPTWALIVPRGEDPHMGVSTEWCTWDPDVVVVGWISTSCHRSRGCGGLRTGYHHLTEVHIHSPEPTCSPVPLYTGLQRVHMHTLRMCTCAPQLRSCVGSHLLSTTT